MRSVSPHARAPRPTPQLIQWLQLGGSGPQLSCLWHLAEGPPAGVLDPPADSLARWAVSAAELPERVRAVSRDAAAGAAFLRACAELVVRNCTDAAAAVESQRAAAAKAAALRRSVDEEMDLLATAHPTAAGGGSEAAASPATARLRRWGALPPARLAAEAAELERLVSAPFAGSADVQLLTDTLTDIRSVLSLAAALEAFCRLPSADITDARLDQADTELASAEHAGLDASFEAAALARSRAQLWRAALGGDNGAFGAAFGAVGALLVRPLRDGGARQRLAAAAYPSAADAPSSSHAHAPLSADGQVLWSLLVEDHQVAFELLADSQKRQERKRREEAAEAARREEAARQEAAARAAEAERVKAEAARAAEYAASKEWLLSKPEGMEVVEDSYIAYNPNVELGLGSKKTVRAVVPTRNVDALASDCAASASPSLRGRSAHLSAHVALANGC